MKPVCYFVIFLLFLFSANAAVSAFPEITKAEADIFTGFETNKNLPAAWNIYASGAAEIENFIAVRGGTAIGMEGSFNIDAFALIKISLPLPIDLSFNTSYIFNAYSDYDTSVHSVIPFVSAVFGRFTLTLGCCFRFLQFNQYPVIREQCFAYRIEFAIIDNGQTSLSIYGGNFSDFMCGNNAAYHIGILGSVPISSRISAIGGFELLQTGSAALAANIYGVAVNGGIRICF